VRPTLRILRMSIHVLILILTRKDFSSGKFSLDFSFGNLYKGGLFFTFTQYISYFFWNLFLFLTCIFYVSNGLLAIDMIFQHIFDLPYMFMS